MRFPLREEMQEMKSRTSTLLSRILLIAIGGMMATALMALCLSASILRTMSKGIVETSYSGILEGVMKSFSTSITIAYGSISLKGDQLIAEGGNDISKTSQVVDLVNRQSALGCAILRRTGLEYTIVQTSIRGADSKRLNGEPVTLGGEALAILESGEKYKGRISIKGNPYITVIEPIVDDSSHHIGALLVCQSLSAVELLIAEGFSVIRIQLILWTAVSALIGSTIGFLLLRSSFRPLWHTIEALKNIAATGGDLTLRIDADHSDETGQLARYFNAFIERLRGEFSRMKAETKVLRDKATELEHSAVTSSSSVNRISFELEELSLKVAEQSQSVSETSSAVSRISQRIETLDRKIADEVAAIEESTGWIDSIGKGIDDVNEKVLDLVERVNTLTNASRDGRTAMREAIASVEETSKKSAAVLAINDLIADVAERTSILAINAAIEAAHAGKSGNGFAVVADEIRVLAEEVALRADETAKGIGDIRKTIAQLVDISKTVGNAFERVDSLVVHASSALNELAADMSEHRSSVSTAIQELSESGSSAKAILAGSTEMKASGRLIIDEMRNLLESARRIEKGIRTISSEAEIITKEAAMTAEAAQANRQCAAALEAELKPYKTESEERPGANEIPRARLKVYPAIENNMAVSPAFFLDLRPAVLEADGTVEDKPAGF